VIATGASETVSGTMSQTYGLYDDGPDTMADFSSRGPCQDGRIKPDLVAPGTWIASMASHAAPNEAAIAWTTIDSNYVYMGGTSMSGPLPPGRRRCSCSTTAARTPTPRLPRAGQGGADQLGGGIGRGQRRAGANPEQRRGLGPHHLTNLIGSARVFDYVDQTILLTTGQVTSSTSLRRLPASR